MIERFALLIGAMKAGTTALYYMLDQHPQIAASRDKEPEFWSDPARTWKHLNAYRELWDWDVGTHEWALEASTSYTMLPVRAGPSMVARRLEEEFRFIYMVRHPLDRIRSQYLHSLAEGWITRPIHEELEPFPIFVSNYQFQLRPYVAAHGREKIHVLQYESFREDPCAAARGVAEFLDLDPGFAFTDPGGQNTSGAYRGMVTARILNRSGALPDSFDTKSLFCLTPQETRESLTALVGEERLAQAESEVERWITPSPDQAEFVRSQLADDLDRFQQDWGIDPWSSPAPRG